MPSPNFIKSLAELVREESLLQRNDRVVVGVSGGPDSIALLYALAGLNASAGFNLSLHVAHLNHQLRGDAAQEDAAFVQATADMLELPCTVERRDIRLLAKGPPPSPEQDPLLDTYVRLPVPAPGGAGSIEEVSRRERYACFERVALSSGSNVVCVGHQADDNAETILHRIVRGTGLRGLTGIPIRRRLRTGGDVMLVRPLLRTPRQALLAFLTESGVPYREDATNEQPRPGEFTTAIPRGAASPDASYTPTRNLIRNVVLPLLQTQINPQVREALLRLGEQARWLEAYLHETVQRTFETLIVQRTDQELVLSAAALARRNRIVQAELIRQAITSFRIGEQELSFSHLVAVCDLLADPASGKQIQLPAGLTVTKRYDRLIFARLSEQPREDIALEIAVHVPGRTVLPVRRLELLCTIEDAGDAMALAHEKRDRLEECLDLDAVHLPLVVRKRVSGERFWPLGAPGGKKVSDFLVDAKVDPAARERVALLCDQLGPIWIVGQRIDERVKLTPRTRKVLRIRVSPL